MSLTDSLTNSSVSFPFTPSHPPPLFPEHKMGTGRCALLCSQVFQGGLCLMFLAQSVLSPTKQLLLRVQHVGSGRALNHFIAFHTAISKTSYTIVQLCQECYQDLIFRCFYTKLSQESFLQTKLRGLCPSSSHSHKQPLTCKLYQWHYSREIFMVYRIRHCM